MQTQKNNFKKKSLWKEKLNFVEKMWWRRPCVENAMALVDCNSQSSNLRIEGFQEKNQTKPNSKTTRIWWLACVKNEQIDNSKKKVTKEK